MFNWDTKTWKNARYARPKVLVRILLVLSALTAVALLLFGGHERAEKIAVYREPLGRQGDGTLR